MKSLDLFSGIGGITYALRGLGITPVAYCEKDPEAEKVLSARMRSKHLPLAPVYKDVCTLNPPSHWKVDMIVAGFPCVGLSRAGKEDKFQNPQTALFHHIVRLVDTLSPSMVFLENVSNICSESKDLMHVLAPFHRRGYVLSWTSVNGYEVGSPQCRKRWFCLAVKPSCLGKKVLKSGAHTPFDWKRRKEPTRLKLGTASTDRVRVGLLGNSVIPDAARFAFLYLWNGSKHPGTSAPKHLVLSSPEKIASAKEGSSMCHGTWSHVAKTWRVLPKPLGMKPLEPWQRIIVNAANYTWRGPVSPSVSTERIQGPREMPCWATPRFSNFGACRVLTMRSKQDLPTQLRFENKTPHHLRGGHPNPVFVEWLMGFPPQFTQP